MNRRVKFAHGYYLAWLTWHKKMWQDGFEYELIPQDIRSYQRCENHRVIEFQSFKGPYIKMPHNHIELKNDSISQLLWSEMDLKLYYEGRKDYTEAAEGIQDEFSL